MRRMTNQQIETLGIIAKCLINSLGMQAENIRRQQQDYSIAYEDCHFFDEANKIESAIESLRESGEKG